MASHLPSPTDPSYIAPLCKPVWQLRVANYIHDASVLLF